MSVASWRGIDTAREHMNVFVLGAKLDALRFNNDAEGHTALAAVLQPLDPALRVMEATGGLQGGVGLCCRRRA
jgi:transposase